jgi:hypothetical protein
MKTGMVMWTMAVASLALGTVAVAGEPGQVAQAAELSDLTLANFFNAGWNEAWHRRSHADGAPDLTLLRVQSNLLLYSLRTDYFYERPTATSKDRTVQYASELFEYSLNRRLMFGVFGNYQWLESRSGAGRDGGTYGAIARLQLIDLPRASYAFNYRVAAPNEGLGERQTVNGFALAGWHDLTPLGLPRLGLYWHVQEESWFGPQAGKGRLNDLTYDLSLARTWSGPDAPLENLSTFVEAYARTDLDGNRPGHSSFTLTPGFRFNVQHHHVFMAGVDLPVSHPRPFDCLARFTYIYSF